ncbi:hypothetical protein IAQ61_011691 [Plenodomus lingam]|uniref:uncharacterized protein n=1 Tax=Leptosphaeria maculans TaxID=5022 RepID=UPI00332018B1|nr:hypothetical protein IAQ61_011691 [Plenodomus lingam]
MAATGMAMSRQAAIELPQASHSSPRGDIRSPRHSRQLSVPAVENQLHNFDDVDITGLQPPPSALTSPTATAYDPTAPSPLEDYPRSAPNSHQRSLTGSFFDNCQPFISRATSTIQQHTSRSSSPTKSLASFIPSRSAAESSASQPKIRALQNWFNGSSAPVKLGLGQRDDYSESESGSESGEEYDSGSEEEEQGNMMASLFNRNSSLTRGRTVSPRRVDDAPTTTTTTTTTKAAPAKPPSQPNASSKFSWLLSTQKNAAIPPPMQSPAYHNHDDELLNINISQALFPHGPADPLAPSSFHDLLTNAEALLSRYQSSYRQLSTALVDARSELSAQEDELDESETRVRHLKMQLETMAERASEQDEQMQTLMADLEFERRARQEEEAARKRSLALIRGPASCEHTKCQDSPRRHNRISGSEISVDSGFESETETDAASVFSRNCLSPTGTERSSIHEADSRDTTPKGKKVPTRQRGSTNDKVPAPVNLQQGGWGCANCEGGAQSAVWGRLAKEREENRTLKLRVESLEEAVESALNVVDGPWGM